MMRDALGGIMVAVGLIAMAAIWLYTTFLFFADGQTALGLVSLIVPPADLVLPFLLSTSLGIAGLLATALTFAGFAIQKN